MRIRTIFATIVLVGIAAAGAYYGYLALEARTAAPSVRGIYQCAMHPQIVSDQPVTCPICGMKLERVDDPTLAARRQVSAGTRGAPLFYRHPMRPDVTSAVPAKDEMGMDYVPVYEADVAGTSDVPGHAGFTLSAARQQLIGVTRARVERRRLDSEIRAVGTVAYDPALYQAIVEYREALDARRQLGESAMSEARRGADAIVRAAALRLRQLGITDRQLPAIAAAGQGPANLLLPGKTAWVYAQVYEYEVDSVRPGQSATINTVGQPGRTYEGSVVAVDPILNAVSRTARVRISVPDADSTLRPESFVQATIHRPMDDVLAVPADAVLHSGGRELVFVTSEDGKFEPRALELGREAGGYFEVRAGLQAGDEVVTSANFLIDSESRFRAALAAFAPPTPAASSPH
jgi:multidrug efflux pump subunit AcrA (membrane-fusion protein)